jgi:CHASE3 domain sensor protein
MDDARAVRSQIAAGFAIPAVILILFGALAYRAIYRFTEARAWASQTIEARIEIAALLNTLVDAESGQRGFVLTRDEGFLQSYRIAMTLIDKRYERLRSLTADTPQQQQRLQAMRPLLNDKLAYMQRAIDTLRHGAAPVQDDNGRLMMNDLRAALTDMDETEQQILRVREENMTRASLALVNTLLLGMVCSVLASFVVGMLLIRRMAHLTRAFAQKIDQLDADLARDAAQQHLLTEQAEAKRDAAAQESARILATAEHLAQQASEILAQVREISVCADKLRESPASGTEQLAENALHVVRGALSLDLGTVDLRRLLGRVHELDTELANILRESASLQVASDRSRMLVSALLFQLGTEPRAHGARSSAVRSAVRSSVRSNVRSSRVQSGGSRPPRGSRPEADQMVER